MVPQRTRVWVSQPPPERKRLVRRSNEPAVTTPTPPGGFKPAIPYKDSTKDSQNKDLSPDTIPLPLSPVEGEEEHDALNKDTSDRTTDVDSSSDSDNESFDGNTNFMTPKENFDPKSFMTPRPSRRVRIEDVYDEDDEDTAVNTDNYERNNLPVDSDVILELAADGLTREERELIERRNSNVGINENHGEGTSILKGKDIDPRERFGNTGIAQSEMDLEKQRRELERYKRATKDKTKDSSRLSTPISDEFQKNIKAIVNSERVKQKDKSKPKGKGDVGEKNLLPANQIDPNSFLGVAFKDARSGKKPGKYRNKKSKRSSGSPGNSSTSSSSDSEQDDKGNGNNPPSASDSGSTNSSDNDDEGSSPSDSSSEDTSEDPSSESDAGSRRKSKKTYSKSWKLKPIPPERYDGTADPQVFCRFMTQATDYIRGNAPRDKYVSIVANFLKGRAYTFYTREVSINLKKWNLEKFFTELFNYCFPANFKAIQRRKLENCRQGNRPVKEYASQLNELFTTVGHTDRRSKVHKLWNGFRPEIQKALWKDKLNPEKSSYKSVLQAAELHEIVEMIVQDEINYHSRHSGHREHQRNHSRERRPNYRPHDNRAGPSRLNNIEYGNRDRHQNGRNSREVNQRTYGRKTNHISGFSSNQHRLSRDRMPRRDREHRPSSWDAHRRQHRERSQQEQAEYERRRAQNLCYKCGSADHISRQCPDRNRISSSSGSNRPPGIPNHNIELSAIQRTEDLREMAETTEELCTLNIGMMNLTNGETSSESYVTELNIIDDEEDGGTSLFSDISPPELKGELEHTLTYFSESNKEKMARNDKISDIFRWTGQCQSASRINSVSLNNKCSYLSID
ncbi:hypothetical protein NP233_g7487 [Leucocoprinus birnbaumii]|uniref:CCHC-type domain-containing protein n=1 Tax=Leucocoprinus birnbaumii TaxID=56174 RepID=A0AAD5VQY6_9AGAR|nr:hypothetical protein NP233_g7487 [Leucocoprinus birnbaumii]